jgi:hypothetical protein
MGPQGMAESRLPAGNPVIARFHAWLCRHNFHDYGIWIEIGGITSPKTVEICTRCGKEQP